MRNYLLVLISITLLALSGCQQAEDPMVTELRSYISKKSVPGVYQNSQVLYTFDEDAMQLCYNSVKRMCRIQSDDADNYLQMTMSAAPVDGETLVLSVKSSGIPVSLSESYEVEVVQVVASKNLVRLIDKATLLGFVLYYE